MPKNKAIYDKSGVSSSQLHHDPGHWDTIAHELRYAFAAEKAIDAPLYLADGSVTTFRKAHDKSRMDNKGVEGIAHPRVEVIDCGGGSAFMWESLNTERRGMYLGHYTNLEYDEKVCAEVSDRIKSQVDKGRAKIVPGSFCGANWRETADRLIAERGGRRYDALISLEALEHLPYLFNGETDEFKSLDEALDFFRYMSDYCILSTPNFSERYGKAEDHTREWRFEELKSRLQARFAKVQAFPIRASKSQLKTEDVKAPSKAVMKGFLDQLAKKIPNIYDLYNPAEFSALAQEHFNLPYINQIFANYPSNPAMHLAAPFTTVTSPKVRNILWIVQNPPTVNS